MTATYRFMHTERVTPQTIQHAAINQPRRACAECPVVLCLHDLTELKPIHPISEIQLLQHTVLAADGGMVVEVSRRGAVGEESPPRNDPRYDEPLAMHVVQVKEINPPDDVASGCC